MTTTVRVTRRAGNKDVTVRIEHKYGPNEHPWITASEDVLKQKGDEVEFFVYDGQRLVIEETGEFTS